MSEDDVGNEEPLNTLNMRATRKFVSEVGVALKSSKRKIYHVLALGGDFN